MKDIIEEKLDKISGIRDRIYKINEWSQMHKRDLRCDVKYYIESWNRKIEQIWKSIQDDINE